MKQFAKLFEFEDLGQVLVMLDRGDDGPEVRLYFKPDGLGVCSVACSSFPGGEDEQWDHAEKGFATVDSEGAHKLVAEAMKVVPDRLG
ncbi:hypothetical protein [Pseudomonas aeruginosa]|uniref:hypothetical protein n=2 Tax=Pseudomonas aeruginosa TaxID=287 RepID=UPI00006D8F0E|nr:hypothetical protein [Pseudomonas aeruginosa]EIU9544730.1 hypothetical protein [Pseudomonas aeruginosa]EKU6384356.1 hypothetical protein [Pseudomonas aeruginosa]EKW5014643.1 hypothetical protein [Pseudomonas aeruginosa]KRU70123.1 hypothetical protein AN448_01370 [Pseudomonas aeruginosa]MBA4951187.1 hypothetical protein [Pseudomonas aeruginosa]